MNEQRAALSIEQIVSLIAYVPHYHAIILGPKLPPAGNRLMIPLDFMVQPDAEAAAMVAWERAEASCLEHGFTWDRGEWDVHILPPCNRN